ncbi:hypothetical protein JQK62_20765, partial [Leptospira santarosai]|nr:hypothetical protein [Leptospira santarosai]
QTHLGGSFFNKSKLVKIFIKNTYNIEYLNSKLHTLNMLIRILFEGLKNMSHPYKLFEDTPLWKAINMALEDLVENKHLDETTPREYIIGHLCQRINGSFDAAFCGDY